MEEKQVILIRKQGTPFTVNDPYSNKSYIWQGTKGNVLNKRPVPYTLFEHLQNNTTVFETGALIIDETDDEDIVYAKENIPNVEEAEAIAMTKSEVVELLSKGNHLNLQKQLNKLTEGKPEPIVKNLQQYVISVAVDEGVDSSAKRKVLCDWAGLEYENADLFFDKNLKEMYEQK